MPPTRLLLTAMLAAAAPIGQAAPVVFTAAGANAAAIQGQVDAFRADLGTLNPNVAGSFGSGRREINWDGVPDAFAAPNNLPAGFFNTNSPRGAVFSTPGTGLQVSANAASGMPVEFGNLNASYPSLFSTFSPQRLFTALGSNVVDVNFFVPGSTTPAAVGGFGAVFTDVDLAGVTGLQFFDPSGASLGTYFATPFGSAGETLSFLGVSFNAGEQVGRVRITAGNAALGPNESGAADVVALDDFIYAEPRQVGASVPEPATALLLCALAAALGLARRAGRPRKAARGRVAGA